MMALQFPTIDPVAFSVGAFSVRWYALSYLAGFLIGWRYILRLSRLDKNPETGEPSLKKTDIDDFLSWAILGVILGGRIGYILFYQTAMIWNNPLGIFELWNGGMSFHGGAAGMIIAMIVFARVRKMPFFRLTDLVCCAVPIGLFFGRIANFINGELFGRAAQNVPWAMVFPRGGDVPRHPSQLYEAGLEGLVLGLVLLAMILTPRIRACSGLVSAAFLGGYALCRMIVENFREPDPQLGFLFADVTMGQLLSVPMVIAALGIAVYAFKRPNPVV